MRACLDENQVGARLGEPDGDGLAYAPRAPRHDGGVVREGEQLGGHGSSSRCELRLGEEGGCDAPQDRRGTRSIRFCFFFRYVKRKGWKSRLKSYAKRPADGRFAICPGPGDPLLLPTPSAVMRREAHEGRQILRISRFPSPLGACCSTRSPTDLIALVELGGAGAEVNGT